MGAPFKSPSFGRTEYAIIAALVAAGIVLPLALYSIEGPILDAARLGAVSLLYTVLLGGSIRLLLDDFSKRRERRAELAEFIIANLADIKSVYDQLERSRILIAAFRSASTYRDEMKAIIQARVTLRNVQRALDRTSGFEEVADRVSKRHLSSMDRYVTQLTTEFQREFKSISIEQERYEARKKAAPESAPDNTPWEMILKLECVRDLIGLETEAPTGAEEARPGLQYKTDFLDPLDAASQELRTELRKYIG